MAGYRQPPLYVEPQAPGPARGNWTGNNNLGASIKFMADATNRQKVLQLPEWGPPKEWTLSLGMQYNEENAPAAMNFRIVAEVTIGVGGATQTFNVDLGRGIKLSATMNSVNVVYKYTTDLIAGGLLVPDDLHLTALLSEGTRPATATGPTLAFLVDAGPNVTASSVLPVPNFARSVSLLPRVDTSPTSVFDSHINVVCYSSFNVFLAAQQMAGDKFLNFPAGYPLAPESRYWNVVTTLGAAAVSLWVQFELGL